VAPRECGGHDRGLAAVITGSDGALALSSIRAIGNSFVQCRQDQLLAQLIFVLLNALPALRAEVLGELRDGASFRHQKGYLTA
jgi:hypothetical protein